MLGSSYIIVLFVYILSIGSDEDEDDGDEAASVDDSSETAVLRNTSKNLSSSSASDIDEQNIIVELATATAASVGEKRGRCRNTGRGLFM